MCKLTVYIFKLVLLIVNENLLILVGRYCLGHKRRVVPKHPGGSRALGLRAEGAGRDGGDGLEVGVLRGCVGRQAATRRPASCARASPTARRQLGVGQSCVMSFPPYIIIALTDIQV